MSGECIRIWLLGSLEVQRRDEHGVWSLVDREAFGKPKHARSVLKRLLTAPGRRLPRAQIQDDLWPELDMQLADSYLYNAIAKVRSAIGRDLVTTNDSIYEIAGQELVWVDIDQVDALMHEIEELGHRTFGAIALLEEALGYLTRGKPLEGEDGTWRHGIVMHAEDMLKQARIWLAESYEAQGKCWQAREQYRLLACELPLDEEAQQLWKDHRAHASTTSAPARIAAPEAYGLLTGIPDAPAGLWPDDLLSVYARGIDACWSIYYSGSPHQVEALLPLYRSQTALLASRPGPLQPQAARLASMAAQLACELLTDRENFGAAGHAAQQAFLFAHVAGDRNLQVGALIGLANLGFHRKLSTAAIHAYEHAISLLDESVTPLLKGRTYAGAAEVYAMRGQFQEAMRAMGLAYEVYPQRPEEDPAYPYLHASRYALYVFGDAQSRLFLSQPKEADKALVAVTRETTDVETEPITKADWLYYQAEASASMGELEQASAALLEGAQLTRSLGSRLYFGKLAETYEGLRARYPHEARVAALGEAFAPW